MKTGLVCFYKAKEKRAEEGTLFSAAGFYGMFGKARVKKYGHKKAGFLNSGAKSGRENFSQNKAVKRKER